jgi:hypothetical protein
LGLQELLVTNPVANHDKLCPLLLLHPSQQKVVTELLLPLVKDL